MSPLLGPIGEGLWTADVGDATVAGFRYPTRMLVIRLPSDDLLIWSPVALSPDLKAQIDALGEVRRSFAGDYGPLYQMAYMMGGLQFYQLHRDFVDSKKMTDLDFHDRILKEGPIPVEMVRAILTNQKLSKDFKSNWRFYSGLPK